MNEDILVIVLKVLEVSSVSAMITHSSMPKRDPSSIIGSHHLLKRSAIDSVFLPPKDLFNLFRLKNSIPIELCHQLPRPPPPTLQAVKFVARSRLSNESFNEGGGGCHIFFPVLGGDDTKIAPPGDMFDQPSGKMSRF